MAKTYRNKIGYWFLVKVLELRKHGLRHKFSDAIKILGVEKMGSELFIEARALGIVKKERDKIDTRRTFVIINEEELDKRARIAERELAKRLRRAESELRLRVRRRDKIKKKYQRLKSFR